jgi:hypothetical protein
MIETPASPLINYAVANFAPTHFVLMRANRLLIL